MFDWAKKTNELHTLFVNSTNAEELRAQRVWRFVTVLWLTWIFFTFFLWFRGYEGATKVCVADSLLHLVILIACRNVKNYRLIMNLNLVASAFGLFFVSISDPAMAGTMLFFPVSILVASQLLGVGAAFSWLVVNFTAFGIFFVTMYGFHDAIATSRFDELVLILGVAVCIFFCCQQGEEYYQERTQNLIDLSESLRKKSEALHELATTDALTGLINRFQFQERLKEAVNHATSNSERMALFLIDMDGFKEINDTLGHPVGDDALVEIATRLSKEFSSESEVARLGGDEFCIIYPKIGDNEHAASIARRICDFLTQRYVLEEAEFPLGASVGFSFCPDHTQSDQELLAYADTAMFYAKENRLGYACYEPDMTDRLVEYRTMQERLSVALERNEFFLVYQPQVDLQSNQVIGVEALLRWRHNGEVISPNRFIHLLEQSRGIIPVSKWIIREACQQLAAWTADGYDIDVSVNVSGVQFKDPEFCQSVTDSINKFGVDATKLDFEITEGLLIDDVVQAVTRLDEIKQMGISISIDDFGTGYSSLSYLRQFPIDRLKIDRSFIKDVPDSDDGVIAASIIVLAKALGIKVLAEGVETKAHIDFLQAHGCDEYQGYYLSAPVSADEVAKHFTRTTTKALT